MHIRNCLLMILFHKWRKLKENFNKRIKEKKEQRYRHKEGMIDEHWKRQS